MKTQIALLIGFALTVQACKKEEPVIPAENTTSGNPTQNFQLTSTVGSYWVYQWFNIDSSGIETPTNQIDSVYVVSDSAMNVNGYVTMVSENLYNGNSYPIYLKDSNGIIVDQTGKVLYSYTQFSTVIGSGSTTGYWNWETRMYKNKNTLVPSGTYSCIEARNTYFNPNGGAVTNCGDISFDLSSYYASNIGLVLEKTGYFTVLKNCQGFLEKRLLRYHIN